ncbi:MAG TPA: deoxyribodipyrimidine photo-lyase, partial [Tepidisphaeraceae bacterium]|nr:deoxyribodipyrimidine photo-lyase [Tepidisphaeraceae bacterium]
MPTLTAVHSARVKHLVEAEPRAGGAYVLYWMQASQRTRFNHALEYAVGRANGLGLPVLVGFGLTDDYPEANARHYLFMLQGLRDVAANLAKRGIGFVIRHGGPGDVAADLARGAAVVVCDRGYLRHQKAWRAAVAGACERVGVPVTQVETDVVVPVDVASNKREWAARTIRPKVHRHLTEFLVPLAQTKVKVAWTKSARGLKSDFDVSDPGRTLEKLKVDRSVAPVPQFFTGGENAVGVTVKSFFGRGST